MRPYTYEEEKFIKRNVGKMTAKQIGEKLGRSSIAINHKVRKLGLDGKVTGQAHPHSTHSNLLVAGIITLSEAGFSVKEIHRIFNERPDLKYDFVHDVVYAKSRREG